MPFEDHIALLKQPCLNCCAFAYISFSYCHFTFIFEIISECFWTKFSRYIAIFISIKVPYLTHSWSLRYICRFLMALMHQRNVWFHHNVWQLVNPVTVLELFQPAIWPVLRNVAVANQCLIFVPLLLSCSMKKIELHWNANSTSAFHFFLTIYLSN